MSYLQFQVDPRDAAYGRLVSGVLGVIRRAVAMRVGPNISKSDIARDAHLSTGHLSRLLNGNVRNVTLRTVSDVLWATKHDPRDFAADPYEDLSPNGGAQQQLIEVEPAKPSQPLRVSSTGKYIDLNITTRPVAKAEPTSCL